MKKSLKTPICPKCNKGYLFDFWDIVYAHKKELSQQDVICDNCKAVYEIFPLKESVLLKLQNPKLNTVLEKAMKEKRELKYKNGYVLDGDEKISFYEKEYKISNEGEWL